ncbi:MAG: hypothetical protein Q4E53_12930 [Eubacteriales bacterium]|nr:hypothetical protein [Eubacteriales bacterium]
MIYYEICDKDTEGAFSLLFQPDIFLVKRAVTEDQDKVLQDEIGEWYVKEETTTSYESGIYKDRFLDQESHYSGIERKEAVIKDGHFAGIVKGYDREFLAEHFTEIEDYRKMTNCSITAIVEISSWQGRNILIREERELVNSKNGLTRTTKYFLCT